MRRRSILHSVAGLVVVCLFVVTLPAEAHRKKAKESAAEKPEKPEKGLPTVAEKTNGMDAREGFVTFHVDTKEGKVWLEVPPPSGERGEALRLIFVEGLMSGLGSNPVGLDRGQISESKLLSIRRIGPRVLFEQPNMRYRALSDDVAEQRATRESFATSVLWAADIVALDEDGRSLIDLTSFLVRDAHRVVNTLRDTEQGSWSLDADRSVVDFDACLAFPDNVELEALLTYAGSEPGAHVRSTAPTEDTISLTAHYSLVRLPDDGYTPRRFDPRAGVHMTFFHDYAVDLDEPIERRWIQRHRLEKVDPEAERSKAKEPLIYYVDSGVPEPVRSALVEGAEWWAEAFEAAGFVDAYRVELLPEGVHPLDVRYNVIQWVHRSTRGWSYGGGVADPRTGEMIKGHVNLGSLRVRQDRLLFEGLLGTAKTGSGAADDPIELALARIRQLSAHEVGHTLGMAHNFAASTYDDRASVMDYPAPLVTVGDDGELDVSRAYGVGIGTWDKQAIRYAYTQFPPGTDEDGALDALVQDGLERGMVFISDADARPAGASEPRANLWDNGADPVAALTSGLAVRRHALDRFGEHNIAEGRPLAELEEVLATVYFHHRFQLDAAAKVLAGMEYEYALRGDGQGGARIVDAERQREALSVLLSILEPVSLDLPESVLEVLLPRPFEYEPNREMFASKTVPAFDAMGAAATAADQVVAALHEPMRWGRLIDFHRRDAGLPGPREVLGSVLDQAFAGVDEEGARHTELRHVVRRVVVDRWLALASDNTIRPALRAWASWALGEARARLGDGVYDAALARDIERFLERSQSAPGTVYQPAPLPPGSPIGSPLGMSWEHGCSAGH